MHCRWIPSCAQLFLDNRRFWFHLVPPNDTDSTEHVRDLFAGVATLMGRQLRELVLDSLAEFLDVFLLHQVRSCDIYVA